MGSTVPAGYLICNGSAVSRTAYDKLFQAIGTKYGEGDGSTTFNLPNLIGKFLQGDTTSGTVKDAGLPNITGSARIAEHGLTTFAIEAPQGCFVGQNYGLTNDNMVITSNTQNVLNRQLGMNASLSNSIYGNSTTVQPPAVTSIPCIKAFDSVIDATTVSVAQLSDTKVNKAGDTMTGSLTAPSFIANGIDCTVDSQGDGWIRYSNGLQMCWGMGVYDDQQVVSYAKAFVESPSVVSSGRVDPENWNPAHFTMVLLSNSLYACWYAIGRWK